MPGKDPDELTRRSRFIFRGEIVRTEAATMECVPISPHTVVVRVEAIHQGPPALREWAGREVTVLLTGQRMKVGQRADFYTNSWLYGEGLALQSVGQIPISGRASKTGVVAKAHPELRALGASVRARVAAADIIVQGRVTEVRLPEAEIARRSAIDAGEPVGPVSEHDPDWQEAVVEVVDRVKGEPAESVVVRFPGSQDVRWYQSPKFVPGQESLFLLQRTEVESPIAGRRGAVADLEEALTALEPNDVLPPDALETIRTLI